MTLSELATLLNTPPPKSYNDLTAQQKQDVLDVLAPLSGFDAPQRAWFKNWWLICTAADITNMNAVLPANTRVAPLNYLGTLYLNIDLATDCMGPGATYLAARSIIRTLVCKNVTPT